MPRLTTLLALAAFLPAAQAASLQEHELTRMLEQVAKESSVCKSTGYRQLLARGAVLRYQFSEYQSNRPVATERFTKADCGLQ